MACAVETEDMQGVFHVCRLCKPAAESIAFHGNYDAQRVSQRRQLLFGGQVADGACRGDGLRGARRVVRQEGLVDMCDEQDFPGIEAGNRAGDGV